MKCKLLETKCKSQPFLESCTTETFMNELHVPAELKYFIYFIYVFLIMNNVI